MNTTPLTAIAVLKAKPGKREDLRAALTALVAPTREETGCLDYALFELGAQPGVFYVRESWADQAALDYHCGTPWFKALSSRFDELLGAPLELIFLNPIA